MARRGFLRLAFLCSILALFSLWLVAPASSEPVSPSASAVAMGQVVLRGCADHSGVTITVGNQTTFSQSDGLFILPRVDPGTYVIRATKPGFLSLQTEPVTLAAGDVIFLSETALLGGDISGDELVDITDLVVVGSNFRRSPPSNPKADLNGDGRVDISDFVMLGANFRKTGPIPWAVSTQTAPTMTPTPTGTTVAPSATSTFTATPTSRPESSTPTMTATAPGPTATSTPTEFDQPTPTATPTEPVPPTATATETTPATPTATATEPAVLTPTPTTVATESPSGYTLRAWLSNEEPQQFTSVTVYAQLTHGGVAVRGALMEAAWAFGTGTAYCTGTTGANGVASCSRNIGAAAVGNPVQVTVSILYAGQLLEATLQFTPH